MVAYSHRKEEIMPSPSLVEVKSYLDPAVYDCMEKARATKRRMSRSAFIDMAVLDYCKRNGFGLTHDSSSRKKKRGLS